MEIETTCTMQDLQQVIDEENHLNPDLLRDVVRLQVHTHQLYGMGAANNMDDLIRKILEVFVDFAIAFSSINKVMPEPHRVQVGANCEELTAALDTLMADAYCHVSDETLLHALNRAYETYTSFVYVLTTSLRDMGYLELIEELFDLEGFLELPTLCLGYCEDIQELLCNL